MSGMLGLSLGREQHKGPYESTTNLNPAINLLLQNHIDQQSQPPIPGDLFATAGLTDDSLGFGGQHGQFDMAFVPDGLLDFDSWDQFFAG